MKKNYLLISILVLFVLACSTTDLLAPTATPLPTLPLPTETLPPTATPMPSLTPTQLPPTFTPVPTLTATASTPSTQAAPSATTTLQGSFTPQASQTAAPPQGAVFDKLTTSGNMITWGLNCQETSVTFTAHAVNGYGITSVLLFTRLQSQSTGVTTRWSNGTDMHSDGAGMFTYSLSARGIPYYQEFQSVAWVQYQLVATDSQSRIVGRSDIVLNSITLTRCP